MLAHVNTLFTRGAVKIALGRKAPETIPLSGMDRLRQRDYYTVSLQDGEAEGKFVVHEVLKEGFEGTWFDGSVGREACIPNQYINLLSIKITQYAREIELNHRSPIFFFWSALTLKPLRHVWMFRFRVWAFGKKRLPRLDRMEVLSWAYNWTLDQDRHKPSFTPLNFLTDKFGSLIVFHPDKDRLFRYYRLVFDSLEKSGELEDLKSSWSFSLSPQALATLDKYQEADRRHADNIRQQRLLVAVTFALVVIGVAQIVVG